MKISGLFGTIDKWDYDKRAKCLTIQMPDMEQKSLNLNDGTNKESVQWDLTDPALQALIEEAIKQPSSGQINMVKIDQDKLKPNPIWLTEEQKGLWYDREPSKFVLISRSVPTPNFVPYSNLADSHDDTADAFRYAIINGTHIGQSLRTPALAMMTELQGNSDKLRGMPDDVQQALEQQFEEYVQLLSSGAPSEILDKHEFPRDSAAIRQAPTPPRWFVDPAKVDPGDFLFGDTMSHPQATLPTSNENSSDRTFLLGTRDGSVWAKEFHMRYPSVHEADALAWFCTAIETGYDIGYRSALARVEDQHATATNPLPEEPRPRSLVEANKTPESGTLTRVCGDVVDYTLAGGIRRKWER